MRLTIVFLIFVSCINQLRTENPIVITTWNFVDAAAGAWNILKNGGTALDAVEKGATVCEELQCDTTVGYGGSPDENSETTLDALIIDGKTMNMGAVGALRRIKKAISVARHVLEKTKHSILVGELATQFALNMGFKEESLITPDSKKVWKKWRNEDHCQPNFWINVQPDPSKYCGPYRTLDSDAHYRSKNSKVDRFNHDTIGLVAVDQNGDIAAGTSTNGAKFKIPGRIGDSPIPGAGAYADNTVGGATATGDGDVMLRFLPSFVAVEEMRRGSSPTSAAREAVKRISNYHPTFMGAVVAVTKNGEHGAACNGIPTFPYVIQDSTREVCEIITINCTN